MQLQPLCQLIQQSQVANKGQQPPRGQPTSFIVFDNQQAGPSRLVTFTLTSIKHFNPPSVASATGEESQHNISGLSGFFENLQSVMTYRLTSHSCFHHPTNNKLPLLQPQLYCKNISSNQPSSASSVIS